MYRNHTFICRVNGLIIPSIFAFIVFFAGEVSAQSIVCNDKYGKPIVIHVHGNWAGVWRKSGLCGLLDLWHECSPEAQKSAIEDLSELDTKYEQGDPLLMDHLPILVEHCNKYNSDGKAACEHIKDTLEERIEERLTNTLQELREELNGINQQINAKLQELTDYEWQMIKDILPTPSLVPSRSDFLKAPSGLEELITLLGSVPALKNLKYELEDLQQIRDAVTSRIKMIEADLDRGEFGSDFFDCD